jgi:hypothetical protein
MGRWDWSGISTQEKSKASLSGFATTSLRFGSPIAGASQIIVRELEGLPERDGCNAERPPRAWRLRCPIDRPVPTVSMMALGSQT